MMTIQQLSKIRLVSVGDPGCPQHIAVSCLQKLDQILLFKLTAGLRQGRYLSLVLLYCVMEKIFGNE